MIRAMIGSGAAVLVLAWCGVAQAQDTVQMAGAHLQALDKISGVTGELDIKAGETVEYLHMQITLHECRAPSNSKNSNAFASLTITDRVQNAVVFDGWMIADSPALSALDHHRYDVWVTRCLGA